MFDATTHKLYTEYHNTIIQHISTTLDDHNISYDIITRYNINHALSTDCSRLLVIFSADIIKDCEEYVLHENSTSQMLVREFKILEHIGRPVLWLSAVDNPTADFDRVPNNVCFIHIGCDILCQMNDYPKLVPQKDKNFSTDKFWISLNHVPRPARIMSASYLMGHDLGRCDNQSTGMLRLSTYTMDSFDNWRDYFQSCINKSTESVTITQAEIMQSGFLKLKNLEHGGQPAGMIYDGLKGFDNATNFDNSLRHLYQSSAVEIVNETVYYSTGIMVSEKFLNSVYGYNLPIVLSNPGTVKYLQQHGFDMFDDVIDISYDAIRDPFQRMITAIESNIKLFTDKNYAIGTWEKCLDRLDSNHQYARQSMYDHFFQQFCVNLTRYLNTDLIPFLNETKIH